MNDYALHLLKKYRKKGILVDTNLLLLYIVGSVDIKLIKEFKRTNTFEKEDYLIIAEYIDAFEVKITTPNILTEVSNFLSKIPKQKIICFSALKQFIVLMEENYLPSKEIAENTAFFKFGLTDSSIAHLTKEKYAVLTADFPLYLYLSNLNFDVLNFNHLRKL